MIFIKNVVKGEPTTITIPKVTSGIPDVLTITSTLGLQVYTFDRLVDISESVYSYKYEITFPDIDFGGQYNVLLVDAYGKTLYEGIATIELSEIQRDDFYYEAGQEHIFVQGPQGPAGQDAYQSHAVLYVQQELDPEQQEQARENIDAVNMKAVQEYIQGIGVQGPQGYDGAQGTQGEIGPQGTQGEIGPQGADGYQGTDGAQGTQGPQGTQGEIGPQGADGYQGTDGAQGPQGTQGEI